MSTTIDEQGNCFACGPANPQGLHLVFTTTANTATTIISLGRTYEGAPGYLHGGIIATLMDEAMSKLSRPLAVIAMTRHLEVAYLHPSPIDTLLTLTSTHLRREGRKLFHTATLTHPDGTILATAKALFIVLKPSTQNSQPKDASLEKNQRTQ
jgi:acyl-CoA thioesterase FadM